MVPSETGGLGRVTDRDDAIYVEIDVDGDLDRLWELTQNPDRHERWDLRFSDIEYLPREDGEPQEFTYRTRIGGIGVAGTGESVGEADRDGVRTSALIFRSSDPKALIREGNGFWRYEPTPDGVRFLTEYNYDTRWGRVGTVLDRLAFRPLLGWATAWSFDRLRRWVEDDLTPEAARRAAVIHALARVSLAAVWLYQGLVPKLLLSHPEELALLSAGPFAGRAALALAVLGIAEVTLGLLLLGLWWRRSLLLLGGTLPVVLTTAAAVARPAALVGPFTPLASTVTMLALGVAGYLAAADAPTARTCRRSRRDDRPTTAGDVAGQPTAARRSGGEA